MKVFEVSEKTKFWIFQFTEGEKEASLSSTNRPTNLINSLSHKSHSLSSSFRRFHILIHGKIDFSSPIQEFDISVKFDAAIEVSELSWKSFIYRP